MDHAGGGPDQIYLYLFADQINPTHPLSKNHLKSIPSFDSVYVVLDNKVRRVIGSPEALLLGLVTIFFTISELLCLIPTKIVICC